MIRQNFVGVIFRLVFVQLRRIEIRSAYVVEHWGLPRVVRNLKIVVIVPGQKREAAGVVDDIRNVSELFELIGVVVDRVAASRRIFNTDAIVQITLGDVITELSGHAAALEAFHKGVETADIDGSFTANETRAVLGVNVDHSGFTKTELGRKRASHQRDVIGKASRQFRAKAGNTFRQKHVVDAVL